MYSWWKSLLKTPSWLYLEGHGFTRLRKTPASDKTGKGRTFSRAAKSSNTTAGFTVC